LAPSTKNVHGKAYKDSNECDQEAGMLCDVFKDMKMYYKNAELHQTIMQKWYRYGGRKFDTKPHMLELYSD